MRAFLVVSSAIVLASAVTAQQGRGVVKTVTASATAETGKFQFTVTGDNPCGAVYINLNDGSEGVTYAIQQLPYTVLREFERVGKHRVTAKGMGNCDGEVTTEVTVTSVRPRPDAPPPPPPPPPQPAQPPAPGAPAIRFAQMDADGDRVISRAEWRGSAASFSFHDWNRDNRLSDEEVRLGASWAGTATRGASATVGDWSEARFRNFDRNGDNRLSRGEWRYDVEDFVRADRDGNNQVTLNEFLIGDIDDDRGDRFDDLDANRDNRVDRNEWHGSPAAFAWLDRNNDGVLTRPEAVGSAGNATVPVPGTGAGSRGRQNAVMVSATRDWVDTGIVLQAGDVLDITASGQIFYAPGRAAAAQAAGAAGRRATASAPMPDVEIGALVGRIADGPVFKVGDTLTGYRAPVAGRLFLRVNDDVLTDNRGEFRAAIAVSRR